MGGKWTPGLALKALAIAGLYLAVPFLISDILLGKVNIAAQYSLVAISLVILTGWSGNISLGQAAIVGVGAYVTGLLVQELHLPFPVNLLWAGVAGALIASVFGGFALRIRGLYLAVATLIFSWLADEFLFRQRWFTKASAIEVSATGVPGTFPYFDWTDRTTFYYGAWAVVMAVIFAASILQRSKTGRALAAVRGSEVAAASLGIDVVRTKLSAFAISGAVAGMAGNLSIIGQQVVTQEQFDIKRSLFFLSIAVVGGLQSLYGAVAASLLFAGLDQLFFQYTIFEGYLDVVSAGLLAVTLLLYRGGLAAIPSGIASALERRGIRVGDAAIKVGEWLAPLGTVLAKGLNALKSNREGKGARQRLGLKERRRKEESASTEPPLDLFAIRLPGEPEPERPPADTKSVQQDLIVTEESVGSTDNGSKSPGEMADFHWKPMPVSLPSNREDRRPVIEAKGITVRFGGLVAVNDYSLTVREGEIVGLIGPNGAGKTTLFNSIAGLNVPTSGRVSLFGRDVTELPVHERARLGVGRTFQAIQLFANLTVFDNLLVATNQHNPTGIAAQVFVTHSAYRAEQEARSKARRALQLLELQEFSDRRVADLPFGVLRMVELARALVTGARIVMLDEPASGLDVTETERLADILRFVRSLGVTLLLIEHDVPMVTSVSDYIYVIDRGNFLAEGTPEEIKRNPAVIAAYLGEAAEPQGVAS